MLSPTIILVNTQLPENIGATARAMSNFGLGKLYLVKPREAFPNKRAYDLAGHAAFILDNAKLFATTQEAISGFERVYAATARNREMVKPVYTPLQAAGHIEQEKRTTAILFGPERTGLTNEDTNIADGIITIPTSSEFSSLNIAQSVVVIAYQWLQVAITSDAHSANKLNNKSELATKGELLNFFDHLERRLDAVNFWKVPEKKEKMWTNLQNIFARNSLTEQEIRSLHGVISSLQEPMPANKKSKN